MSHLQSGRSCKYLHFSLEPCFGLLVTFDLSYSELSNMADTVV